MGFATNKKLRLQNSITKCCTCTYNTEFDTPTEKQYVCSIFNNIETLKQFCSFGE